MRPKHGQRSVAARARRQHGNVTLEELRASGLSPGAIRTEVAAGRLLRRHRGVFAVGHVPRTRVSRWHAAVLALGPGAALSHRAAGAHWAIVKGAVPTEVTIPPIASRASRDGILVHRAAIAEEDVVSHDGVPTTALARTLVDLGQVVSGPRLMRAFEEAQIQYGLKPETMALELLSRPWRPGNGPIRAALVGAVDPTDVASLLELRFLMFCAAHDIPRPEVNRKLGHWCPDFHWPEAGVIVETDGARFHDLPSRRARDTRKDDALTAEGLLVIRLRWADVHHHADATAQRLQEILRTRSRAT